MTTGRQQKINQEINWITDEDGNVLGYVGPDGREIPMVPKAGKSTVTYTLGGSSLFAYAHVTLTVSGLGATFQDMGGGRVRVSGTKIARTFRRGGLVRVGGMSPPNWNQFMARILDHDNTSTLGWFEYDVAGPMYCASPSGATKEITLLNEADITPNSSRGPFSLLHQALGRNLRCVGNFAIAGGDSEQNIDIFANTHALVRPDYVFSDIPTNDLYARLWPASRIKAATLKWVSLVQGIGATPVPMLTPSRSVGVTAGILAEHMEVNEWAKSVLPGLGCLVIDPTRASANAGSGIVTFTNVTDVNYAPSTGFLNDGVHLDRPAGKALSALFANALSSRVPPVPSVRISNAAGAAAAKSLFKNVELAGTGAAPTGFTNNVVPTGTTLARTGTGAGVLSKTARTVASDGDAFGSNFTIEATGSANNDSITVTFSTSASGLNMQPGEYVRSAIGVSLTNQTGVKGFSVQTRLRHTYEDALFGDKAGDVFSLTGTELRDDFIDTVEIPDVRMAGANEYPQALSTIDTIITLTFSGVGTATLTTYQPSQVRSTT